MMVLMRERKGISRDALLIVFVLLSAKLLVLMTVALAKDDWFHFMVTRWDGAHYTAIAAGWYTKEYQLAFAPLLPILARPLILLGASPGTSVFIVANAFSFLPPLLVLRLWGKREALFFSANPVYALFTTFPYAESLALTFLLAGLWALKEERPLASGLLFGLAVLSKYSAVLPIAGLSLYLLAFRREWRLPRLSRFYLPIGFAGLVSGLLFYLTAGNPLAYLEVERGWDAKIVGPIDSLNWLLARNWFTRQDWRVMSLHISPELWALRHLLFLGLYVLGLALLIKGRKDAEFWYSLPTILLQASIRGVPLISTPRLLLPAVPAWGALGEKLGGKGLTAAVVLMLLLTPFITCWHVYAFFA